MKKIKYDEWILKKEAIALLGVSNPTFLKFVRLGYIKKNQIAPRLAYYSKRSILDFKSGKTKAY